VTAENSIKVRNNGPLLCTGEIEVYDPDGGLIEASDDIALCRCGASAKKPFCDGSHRGAAFEHDGCFEDARTEPLGGEGPLQITVRTNAMLLARGPVTIACADGSCISTRNKVALCRCGHSANKPFCDASHKQCGFEG